MPAVSYCAACTLNAATMRRQQSSPGRSSAQVTAARRLSSSDAGAARHANSSGPSSASPLLGERRVVLGVAATASVGSGSSRVEPLACVVRERLEQLVARRPVGGRRRRPPSTWRPSSPSASSTSQASIPSPATARAASARRSRPRTRRGGRTPPFRARRAASTTSRPSARSVWWRSTRAAPPAGEQPEPLVEQRPRSRPGSSTPTRGRGELDRERDAVEPAADLRDRAVRSSRRVAKSPAHAAARSTNRRTASFAASRRPALDGPSGQRRATGTTICSPAHPSASRLVARIRTLGHSRRTLPPSRPPASSRCSQLSSTSSSRLRAAGLDDAVSQRHARTRRARRAPPRRPGAIASASVGGRELAQPRAVRESAAARSAATCSASRVLPTPPTPVSVTSRARPSAVATRGELVVAADERRELQRQVPGNASSDRSGGNSPRSPGCATWNTRSAARRSRRRCSPRSTQLDVGASAVARPAPRSPSDTTIWPPCADRHQPRGTVQRRCRSSRRRAAPPRRCAGPSAPATAPSRPRLVASARCAVDRAPTARVRASRTPRDPSPVVFTTCPPCAAIASRRISSWRASAACIASGCSSHRRVEPSRSVNKNVTVPDGSSATPTPSSLRPSRRK